MAEPESEDPFWEQIQNAQSYLSGGNYAGLGTTVPIFISNLLGMPRQYPYVLNLNPDRDAYQSFYDRQISSQLSPVLNDVRQRNYAASEENLTLIAAKLGKVFGIDFGEEQVDIVRNLAHMTAKYGPGVLQGIKKVLQADGVTDDDTAGKIIEGLTSQLDQVFDALYGPVGDRIPFFGALKDSVRDTVAVDEQAALLQNVVQRLYPNDTTLDQTHGMTAKMVGQLYTAMNNRGLSPLNMNSVEAQRLIRENIQKEVSPAERKYILDNLAKKRRQKIYEESESGHAVDTLIRTTNEKNLAAGKNTISSQIAADYLQKVYEDKYISNEIYKLGLKDVKNKKYLLKKGETLSDKAATIEDPEKRNKYLQGVATAIQSKILDLTKDGAEKNAKEIQQITRLRDQVIEFANADKNYVAAGGLSVTDRETGEEKVLYGRDLITNLNIEKKFNLQQALINENISPEEANDMAYAIGLKDRIESIDGISDAYALVTDEEYRKKILDKKDLTPEARESILQFTSKQELLGGRSWAEYARDSENRIKEISEKQAEENYERVRASYIEVLNRGNMQEILDFENDAENRDVVSQIKANEVGKSGSETITNWTAAYDSMKKAIERTGGKINGQKIQFFPQTANQAVIDVMNLITQNDLGNMSGDEINDLFTSIGTGMQRANLDTDTTLNLSASAAEEAKKVGGDRVIAGKTGTQLGLAAASLARQRGYGNADRIASMVAQATGRASKSLITQYTGAISYNANDETLKRMRNPRAKQIVEKIKNMENLSQDDLSYLQEHGQEIMSDMGMSPDQQRSAMVAQWAGKRGEYALAQGTTFLLGNRNSDMLIATRDAIGTNLTSAGVSKSVARNKAITQTLLDTMTDNISYIREGDMENFKKALLTNLHKKLENKEITQEEYNEIANKSAGDLFQAANRGKDIVGKFTGDWQKGLETISISNNILDEKTRETIEGKAQELFPTIGSENMYSNIIQEMKKPNANLGSILTTFLTNGAKLESDQIEKIGYGVAIMSLLRPEDHISDFDYSSASAKAATQTLKKLAKANPEQFDKTAELISKTNKIIKTRGFGSLENALNTISDPKKVEELMKEDPTFKEDMESLQQTKTLLDKADLKNEDFTTLSSVIHERSTKTQKELEKTPNFNDKTPLTSSSRRTTPKTTTSGSTEESTTGTATEAPGSTTAAAGVTTTERGSATSPTNTSTSTVSPEQITAQTNNTNTQSTTVTTPGGTSTEVAQGTTRTDSTVVSSIADNDNTAKIAKDISELLSQVVANGNLKVVVTNTVATKENAMSNTGSPITYEQT